MVTKSERLSRSGKEVSLHVSTRLVLKVLLIATLFYSLVQIVALLSGFFLTLAIAAFLAIAADPAVRALQDRGMGRGPAVLTFVAGLLTVLAIVVAVFVPPLVDQGNRIIDDSPSWAHDVQQKTWYKDIDARFHILESATEQAEKLPAKVSKELGTVVSVVVAGLFGLLTILFLMIFLLMGGGQIVEGLARVFPQLTQRRWWGIVQDAYRSIGAYVAGSLLVALIAGASIAALTAILGLPYALPLGLWMMMLDLIPLIGATLGAVPAIIVAFSAGGVTEGLIMLVFVAIYQVVIENTFLQPWILGKVVSLSPLIIFISILVGSELMGVLGALFAIPIAGIVQILVREWMRHTGVEHDIDLPPIAPDEAPGPPDIDGAPA